MPFQQTLHGVTCPGTGSFRRGGETARNGWKAERDKEKGNKVAQQVRRAAALTAELAAQSEKKTAVVCDQPAGLGELAGHTGVPNMAQVAHIPSPQSVDGPCQ